jgi:hypothetical protein
MQPIITLIRTLELKHEIIRGNHCKRALDNSTFTLAYAVLPSRKCQFVRPLCRFKLTVDISTHTLHQAVELTGWVRPCLKILLQLLINETVEGLEVAFPACALSYNLVLDGKQTGVLTGC